ncbi:BMP family lipoprotein [Falsibacillus albus]|uniref:BMP family ABC transporter substrate-binding protein n=1 Tax=Falsibacillus albus TaxID=2478915 RepID=A0A3L7JXF8_9BACI|nr:BMP family ABC transporter substrate-binding protein [Falsibacillus albus]RLQ93122.1 BMP family ABC transporter substrate-binding protein [Falsibacillus albus]
MFKYALPLFIILSLVLSGCSSNTLAESPKKKEYHIGILLSDTGLGDGSFNDSAFRGLEKARDTLGFIFDYREAPDGHAEEALEELVKQKNDFIIGLGFSAQEPLEAVAKKHPNQKFILIDGVSSMKNIKSITFKEQEGSFLVGMIAGMTTKSNTLGFIGGAQVPVIEKFKNGFISGVKYVKPDAKILVDYANGFSDSDFGSNLASKQIAAGADFIYPAAGFTGVGSIKTAEKNGVYTAGVDSDQHFIAEKSIVTSMMKNIDIAVYNLAKDLKKNGKISMAPEELGLEQDGVGLAPITLIQLTKEQEQKIEDAKKKIVSGEITIPESN